MMTDPSMVFSTDPPRGLVARSGWEQEEARTVLRDLGWEWSEELHALVPPDDLPEAGAGLQAVEELHLHGHRTGYAVGPYGKVRLTLDRAKQVFTNVAASESAATEPGRAQAEPRSTYGDQGGASGLRAYGPYSQGPFGEPLHVRGDVLKDAPEAVTAILDAPFDYPNEWVLTAVAAAERSALTSDASHLQDVAGIQNWFTHQDR